VEEPSPLGPSGFAISIHVSASPNVLFAGSSTRDVTTITAQLSKFDRTTLGGRSIYFEVRNAVGSRVDGLGYFEGYQAVASKVTDGNGTATINYYGPLASEILTNQYLYIYAHVAWEGIEGISELTPVYMVSDLFGSDLQLNVTADPNVLWCASQRPESVITAYFTMGGVTPVVGRKIFFEITKGNGKFEDGKTKTYKTTGSDGSASIVYQGPTNSEMSLSEDWVYFRVQAETWWEDIEPGDDPDDENLDHYLHAEFRIRLKKGND
jgi:hypothetical protein